MIDVPTLFILGAGSSNPYGYPTGKELREEIVTNFYKNLENLLQGETSIKKHEKTRHLREAGVFIDVFDKSSIESIDKFLSLNPFFSYYGKIAITLSILQKEKSSTFREAMGPSSNNQDWYKLLFNRMISAFTDSNDFIKFRENKIAFITFNYDRSLEHFIYESFIHTFWEKRNEFERDLNKEKFKTFMPFPIIHVYGQVDEIVWHGGRNYREDFDFKTIEKLSTGIRVIGERSDNFIENFSDFFNKYKRLFFLGFGYAEENIDAIGIPGVINEKWDIYGTAKGMTEKEVQNIKSVFVKNFNEKILAIINPRFEDKTSYELLREYL